MTTTPLSPSQRSTIAAAALDTLGSHRHEAALLHVDCPHSHHLATVYQTAKGLVYAATVQGHGHGKRDRFDSGHHGHDEARYLDLLVAAPVMADDALPAWCECGPRTLSRVALQGWIRDGEHRVVVE